MSVEVAREVLGWCALLNYAVLLWWFLAFTLARERVRRLHGRWFRLAPEQFDAAHYTLMGAYKLGIFLLNLVPWIALHLAA